MLQDLPPLPPVPPLPPMPPLPQAAGLPEEVAILSVIAIIVGAVLLFPLVRALARRLEGKGAPAQLQAEIDALHQRVAELESVEHRLAELENRMEFSERLLTQRSHEPGARS